MTERWRDIDGFPDYEVSDMGRVLSHKLRAPRFLARSPIPNGYLVVGLVREDGIRITCFVHRLVLTAFCGPPGPGLESCHGNGNRADSRLSNLRWDTHVNNMADRVSHGTVNHGERNGHSVLTEQQVLEIREHPGKHHEIAKAYGVGRSNVTKIKNRETWPHLPEK